LIPSDKGSKVLRDLGARGGSVASCRRRSFKRITALGVKGLSPSPYRQGSVVASGGEGKGKAIQDEGRLGFRVGFRLDGHDFLLPFGQPFRAEARKGEPCPSVMAFRTNSCPPSY